MTCAIVFGLTGSLAGPAFAAGGQTGIISGVVVDSTTQSPIEHATVSVASPSGSYSAQTAANGSFTVIGVNVDTYVVSVSAPGYQTYVVQGATVTGDQTLALHAALSKIQVIGSVRARSASGAFQPTQTVDSYTVTGARIAQSTGSPLDTSLNDVVLSAPGVSLTYAGMPTIRGGGQREVGYQFDGVPFTDPFLGSNGAAGLFNGLGSVQVVEGAGDAGQGNIGSGVINVIPKRGTYPGFGDINYSIGGPNFDNAGSVEYGDATSDGTFSNYVSFTYTRDVPYIGFHNQDAASYGNYFNLSRVQNNQFLDNFVFRFGKDKNQSLQVLYANIQSWQYGDAGGEPPGTYPNDPFALPYYNYDTLTQGPAIGLVAPTPYTPSYNVANNTPELVTDISTRLLKFEYDNNLSSSTFLAVRYFNWERLEADENLYSQGPTQQSNPLYQVRGGPTAGASFDLTQQIGDKLTVTLNGDYYKVSPIWNDYQPLFGTFSPNLADFEPPSATDPCPYITCQEGITNAQIPTPLINYNNSFFQNYGGGVRFQYNPTARLRFDFGVRYEGQNQHWYNPYNPNNVINPFDVPPVLWTAQSTNPKVTEPRFAASYQFDPSDAIRISYGRAAVFENGQTTGTPFGIYGSNALYASLPPNLNGATPIVAGAPVANQCGTALNGIAGTFPCANYLQQLYWGLDRILDAPDAGGTAPAIYNNYDLSYSHQFAGGYAFKLTPFVKTGSDLPSFSLLKTLPGGNQVFSAGSAGINKTAGLEFGFTTADRTVGLSGFVSGTYVNVLQSAPPLSNGEFNGAPLLSPATLALGDLYHAGYVAPVSVRIGGTYTFKDGFSITPIVQIQSGYPYNVGNTIASELPDGTFANLPQVNFGSGLPIVVGYQNQVGAQLNTNYYDPAYSGSQTSPNIAATRGTPGSSQSGGITWVPNVEFNMTLQYKHGRNTLGVQLVNLFTNGYNGTTPAVNPFYQPVGNGVSGPQTGQNTCTATYGAARGCAAIPSNAYAFSNGAYLLTNGNIGTFQLAPLAPMSINVFYKYSF